jgi:periplasmic protein TonB
MFERYLTGHRTSWRRRALVSGSIGAHVLALSLLGASSLMHVEELAPPPLVIAFVTAPPPPPPSRAANASQRGSASRLERRARQRPSLRQPTSEPAPPDQPMAVDEPAADSASDGVAGGVPGSTATAAGPVDPPPRVVASAVFDRDRLAYPDPPVPASFRERHARETVRGLYRICVGRDGQIVEVTALRGIPGLDDTLITHLKSRWSYKPQPTPVCTPRLFTFEID